LATLEKSLAEKHRESAFVKARTRGKGKHEEFLFTEVIHATTPSIERFLSLIEDGQVCHDLAMHKRENGSARDHGFLFRITRDRIPSLYSYVQLHDLRGLG
jgi:hypothetical protein